MLESSFFPVRSDPGLARLAGQKGHGAAKPQPVFRMEVAADDDRINGSIPVWTDSPSATDRVAGALTDATQAANAPAAGAQAYADPGKPASVPPHPFGFGDLLDMVNPLQHIPLVSNIYRYLTGDTIQPIAQIVGDTIFGGPLGAAGALVNVVVKDATGKDIAGNLVALAFNKDDAPPVADPPNEIAVASANDDLAKLPGTVIGFADLGNGAARAASAAASVAPASGTPTAIPPMRVAMNSETFSAFDIY
jgi:hypothetical protein